MTLPVHVALVSESAQVETPGLASVSAAVQLQVTRDFGPSWGVSATVDAFPTLDDVPTGSWPVIVRDDIGDPTAAGFHLDENGQPYALVQYSNTWSLTVSHETIEMLGDPSGNRTQAGASPKDGTSQVQFLVELCDPCEDAQYAYSINGILVSDFLTSHYYDPVPTNGVRYSFTGAVPGPRQLLPGGYISFLDPTNNHMWQETWFDGPEPQFQDLTAAAAAPPDASLREWVDRNTAHPQLEAGASKEIEAVAHALARGKASRDAQLARGDALRREISRLLK